MDPRPRLLLLGPPPAPLAEWLAAADVTPAGDPAVAAAALRADQFAAVVSSPEILAGGLATLARDEMVLSHMDEGVAALDPDGVVLWANPALRTCCAADPVGRPLLDALGTTPTAEADPFATARRGQPLSLRLHRPAPDDHSYVDLTVRPVRDADGVVTRLVVVVRNVTPEVEQQRKLDALHQAGRELAGLDPTLLAEMNIPTRVELLKQNLRRYIHDLLHYDIIELRLLDRRDGQLRPLLEDGMTPQAANRVLYAQTEGNGVTGYVAATGHSYLCADTTHDPLYLQGANDARSSMTVPLIFNDEVIGTLNVESPRPNGFGPDDLQFTELFSREIAAALHTLDLLTAQQTCTAGQSIDAVNREIALPVDEVLGAASALLGQLGEADPAVADRVRKIIAAARAVKENVRKVGREMAGTAETPGPTPLAGKRVLVVDTDERVRKQAHVLIARLGAGVETAGNATDGLALAAGTPYDAVLLDIKPGDMGGYEAYRRFRVARPAAQVALTSGFGYDSAHSIVKARADGMQHLLFKPFRQDQVVKAVLDGARPVGPSAAFGPS